MISVIDCEGGLTAEWKGQKRREKEAVDKKANFKDMDRGVNPVCH